MRTRPIVDLVLLLAILVLPWWLGLVLLVAGAWKFNLFYEAPLLMFIHNLIYELDQGGIWGWQFTLTALLLFFIPLVEIAKKRIIFYH